MTSPRRKPGVGAEVQKVKTRAVASVQQIPAGELKVGLALLLFYQTKGLIDFG